MLILIGAVIGSGLTLGARYLYDYLSKPEEL